MNQQIGEGKISEKRKMMDGWWKKFRKKGIIIKLGWI